MESKELTIVIVTFKSDEKIINCLNSIAKEIPVVVVENSNNEKKYTALTNIMYNLFFMFIVLNVVVIIEIFFPNIPKFPLNLIKIIAIGIGCTLAYISYQDHYTRDDYDYDKYKFSNDKAVYTNVSGTTSSINNDIESGTKVNECVLDLCENGNCCPDEMFFDRVKGMCVVGTENTISNE